MDLSNKRIVQRKDKKTRSVYVTFPSDKTGLEEGDVVEFKVMDNGVVLISKMKSHDAIKKHSFFEKLLETLGIDNHVEYEWKEDNPKKTTIMEY